MPRRRRPQPPTPDNLPQIPYGATKKEYYPAGNLVYYLQTPDDVEWRRGEVSEETTSTTLHIIIDETTRHSFNVRAEYIRERSEDITEPMVSAWSGWTLSNGNWERYRTDTNGQYQYDSQNFRGWSVWSYDPQNQTYYRVAGDPDGNLHYDYSTNDPESFAEATSNKETGKKKG